MSQRVMSKKSILTVGLLTACLILGAFASSVMASQQRIVVLPFYVEEGRDANDGGNATLHFRRMMRFINNQLVRHDFEVINPFARDASEREFNRVMERAREDSAMASMEVCKRYAVDAAYIVWLRVKVRQTQDGFCKAKARLDGEGFDSAGHDLGIGVSKTWVETARDCDDAIAECEKEVGDVVGRKLTAWSGGSSRGGSVGGGGAAVVGNRSASGSGGALKRNLEKYENILEVRLDGATEYEAAEVMGKVINTATGVLEAKRYASNVVPNNPKASWSTWRVTYEGTDPFRLQSNIMTMINQVLDAGGELTLKGVPYRYTAAEVNLLMGIRTGSATSRMVQFVFDRERMRDREFSGRHDPYKARKRNKPGFE
ncbi:MAG: hypothetical protein J7M09_04260 [Deltaproteobacteria bacterium]|nr:hypothetical protein [Candidatus Tharpella sp.]